MPELANQCVRFAVLHIERFTKPPKVVIEHYPVLTFDTAGNLDLELQYVQLQADVDRLEATDRAPELVTTVQSEPDSTWHPDPTTRRRLIAATKPSYATRHPGTSPHHGVPAKVHGGSLCPARVPPTLPTPHHRQPATPSASAPPRR